MSKDQFKGLFSLWVFVIVIELVWLFGVTLNEVVPLIPFIITLIAATLTIGAVGIYIVGKSLE